MKSNQPPVICSKHKSGKKLRRARLALLRPKPGVSILSWCSKTYIAASSKRNTCVLRASTAMAFTSQQITALGQSPTWVVSRGRCRGYGLDGGVASVTSTSPSSISTCSRAQMSEQPSWDTDSTHIIPIRLHELPHLRLAYLCFYPRLLETSPYAFFLMSFRCCVAKHTPQ